MDRGIEHARERFRRPGGRHDVARAEDQVHRAGDARGGLDAVRVGVADAEVVLEQVALGRVQDRRPRRIQAGR